MQEGFVNYNAQNFDANQMAMLTQTVILFVPVIDVSPSISSYVKEMNDATRELFIYDLKKSHRAQEIMVKVVVFNDKVEHKSGFVPLLNLPDDFLEVQPRNGATALYQAVFESLEAVIQYREELENQGIDVRVNLFMVTDGDDNSSPYGAATKVKDLVDTVRRKEEWSNSFTFNMVGVGQRSTFERACRDMGFDPDKILISVGATGKELRKAIGVVSQSVSSSSNAGQAVSF